MTKPKHSRQQIINKKARFEYEIIEELEAGLVLVGHEVKSLRLGRGNLTDSFVHISEREAYLVNANILGYSFADLTDYDPRRRRKLLLSKKQIDSLEQKVKSGRYSLIPLKIYPKGNVFKLAIAIARGKKQYEKKEAIKRRDLDREARTELKHFSR